MNKYHNLISNTILFGISTFGSKVLVLLLTRLWTELLAPDALGLAELITNACNLILPMMYICMGESVIRFAMDKSYRRNDVFSVGLNTVLIGWGALWVFFPLLSRMQDFAGRTWLIYLYCLASAARTVIISFVRASGLVRVFAIDGIVTTATTLLFNLLFMLGFQMGATGFVLGTIVADALSALGLYLLLRLYRFHKLRGIPHDVLRDMARYALPLVPTAVAWWITSASDKFFIKFMIGLGAMGIYSAAQRIPNLIMQVSTFFTRAWELSAFTEYGSKEGERFFSNVFRSYYTFIFLVASALILFIKPFTQILLAKQYQDAWQYSPYLILAVSFSCLVTFLGAVYNSAKKNMMVSVTTIIGAVLNLALNWLLIPASGPKGAAFATFVSFVAVFIIRAVDSRRYIRIQMQPPRIVFNLALLLLQAEIGLRNVRFWPLWEGLILCVLIASNFGYLLFILRRLLSMLRSRRAG